MAAAYGAVGPPISAPIAAPAAQPAGMRVARQSKNLSQFFRSGASEAAPAFTAHAAPLFTQIVRPSQGYGVNPVSNGDGSRPRITSAGSASRPPIPSITETINAWVESLPYM